MDNIGVAKKPGRFAYDGLPCSQLSTRNCTSIVPIDSLLLASVEKGDYSWYTRQRGDVAAHIALTALALSQIAILLGPCESLRMRCLHVSPVANDRRDASSDHRSRVRVMHIHHAFMNS